MSEQTTDLKPCPVCGGAARFITTHSLCGDDHDYSQVLIEVDHADVCVMAEAMNDEPLHIRGACVDVIEPEPEDAESWNHRPIEDALRSEIAQLQAGSDMWRERHDDAHIAWSLACDERDALRSEIAALRKEVSGLKAESERMRWALDLYANGAPILASEASPTHAATPEVTP